MITPAASFSAQTLASPLRQDEDGALRVGECNVLLELVIRAFQDGATPETIVHRYSTLALADAYAVVAMYLKDPTSFNTYLAQREEKAAALWEKINQSQPDLADIRARLQRAKR